MIKKFQNSLHENLLNKHLLEMIPVRHLLFQKPMSLPLFYTLDSNLEIWNNMTPKKL